MRFDLLFYLIALCILFIHARTIIKKVKKLSGAVFLDAETGELSLQTILPPVDANLPYKEAWLWLADFVRITAPYAKLHLLHVGSEKPASAYEFSDIIEIRRGPVVETILDAANEIQADLIAMPTMSQRVFFYLACCVGPLRRRFFITRHVLRWLSQ